MCNNGNTYNNFKLNYNSDKYRWINLGKPVSHGCVRLDINDAKWLYEFVPSGTTVKIY